MTVDADWWRATITIEFSLISFVGSHRLQLYAYQMRRLSPSALPASGELNKA